MQKRISKRPLLSSTLLSGAMLLLSSQAYAQCCPGGGGSPLPPPPPGSKAVPEPGKTGQDQRIHEFERAGIRYLLVNGVVYRADTAEPVGDGAGVDGYPEIRNPGNSD